MEYPAFVIYVTLALLLAGVVPTMAGSFSSSVQLSPGTTSPTIPAGTVDPEYSVTTWVPSATWNGTTIFGNSATGEIVEVNMLGQVVWRYKIPYSGGMPPVITDVMVIPRSNNVLYSVLDPSNMRGAYEVNRQGQLVWSYLNKTTAHDAVRLPNGDTLLVATHSEDYGSWPYTYPEVFEVGSQGNVVWQWYARTDYANNTNYAIVRSKDFGSWTHTNEALRLPNGNTVVSLRNFNITIIVDSSGKVLQSFGDPCSGLSCKPSPILDYPDSPYPLPNGNYLIAQGTTGNMIEYSPAQRKIIWQWPPVPTQGTPGSLLVLGGQRFPNGNTLVVDGHGQFLEVTPAGQVAWLLRCSCYSNMPGTLSIPFFRAERTSYMPPGFTVSSPRPGSTYSGSVPLTVSPGVDLGNLTYSIRNNSNNTWIARNATLIQNLYTDSLDAPKTINGPSSLSLSPGNYTLRLVASSSGFGYKAFVQQKQVNYATQDINFFVTAPAITTTTSTSTSASTSSRVTTLSSTTSRTQSSSSTPSSSTATISTTLQTSSSSGATSTIAGGGGIPEFPYQALTALAFAAMIVTSYTIARRRSRNGPPP